MKIVIPKDGEILFATLEEFSEDEAKQLSKRLREHYSESNWQEGQFARALVQEIKLQSGI
ncbi:MAG: hypothetical protein HY652_10020 [Acidobacteria bacterium]|nr:hypothetical protein [Acidobacteriota bacterium]